MGGRMMSMSMRRSMRCRFVDDDAEQLFVAATHRLTPPPCQMWPMGVDEGASEAGSVDLSNTRRNGTRIEWPPWWGCFCEIRYLEISVESALAIEVLMAQRHFLMLPPRRCKVETTIRNGEGGQLLITSGWFRCDGSIAKLGRRGAMKRVEKRPEAWRQLAQFWYPK
jgi:hypothetical protein